MGSICNLVGEFNGLVSTEGSAFAGPLVFLTVNCLPLTDNSQLTLQMEIKTINNRFITFRFFQIIPTFTA